MLGKQPKLEDVVEPEAAPLVRAPASGLAGLRAVAGGAAPRAAEEVFGGVVSGKRARRFVAFVGVGVVMVDG